MIDTVAFAGAAGMALVDRGAHLGRCRCPLPA
jgi:hypothetical protein